MDLQALDDLIAVFEAGSVTAAAARRNVTQPAFSRRLQAIEKALGIEVIRRGSKPAQASDALTRNIEEIRTLADSMRRLENDLVNSANPERVLTVAALHAIAVAHLPPILNRLNETLSLSRIRLRAANRDECFTWLMTGQVGVMVLYETEGVQQQFNDALVERVSVAKERMIPVCSRRDLNLWCSKAVGPIALVGYPEDSVLGRILRDEILTRSPARFSLAATTAFSSAVLELAEHGLGVAWVPEHLAADKIDQGRIVRLDDSVRFPEAIMTLSMLRLRAGNRDLNHAAWWALQDQFRGSRAI